MNKILNIKRKTSSFLLVLIVFALNLNFRISFNFFSQADSKPVYPLSASISVAYEWYKTWGGVNSESGYGIAFDSSNNTYISGYTNSFGAGNTDMVLVKFNSSGNQIWNKTWGGSEDDYGKGVAIDSSDNIYVVGYTYSFGAGESDMCLVKYDNSGVFQWSNTWGGSKYDEGHGIAVDSSDNIYIVGNTDSFGAGQHDIILVKYSNSGVLQWNTTWGESGEDYGKGITLDTSDNAYLAGYAKSFGNGNFDVVLVKYNSSGVEQWSKSKNIFGDDRANAILYDPTGNIYIIGTSYGVQVSDMFIVKFDSSGDWKTYQAWGGDTWDEGIAIMVDSLNYIYVLGNTKSFGAGGWDTFLVKYDGGLGVLGYCLWGGSSDDYAGGLICDSSDNFYITGRTDSFGGGGDLVLVKFGADSDEDGLSNDDEVNIYSTDPNDSDSDDDGLSDGDEVNTYSTDPNDSDSDDDGLSDGDEVNIYFTDPNDSDSDDDGFNDGVEANSGTDPNNNLSNPGYIIVIIILVIFVIIIAFFVYVRKKSKEKRIEKKKRKEQAKLEAIERRKREAKRKEGMKMKIELEQKFPMIDQLIQERKYSYAIKELKEIMDVAETYYLDDVLNWARKKLYISNTYEKILNLFQISDRVKVNDLASSLEIDRGELFTKIGEWGRNFDFTIDGDYIKIKSENMGAFMDALDKSFEEWGSPEKKRQKKL